MHPVTIAALAVLMVNDLVFKALWSGDWTTGKLSDLAWMVFAPSLLAFLLSLAAPHKPGWHRAILLTAYLGLPLLYLAYNSIEPLHDAIIGVFLLASYSPAGSPFDPTDSLVIPIGIAVAIWVRRQTAVNPKTFGHHSRFVVAALACFAMVATSPPSPQQGIETVGVDEETGLATVAMDSYSLYISPDGGLTWDHTPQTETSSGGTITWGTSLVETPRGQYRTLGPEIRHSVDGRTWTVSYSLDYLDTPGNDWILRKRAHQLLLFTVRTDPETLVYHGPTGNVIADAGIQGALVNTPDGQWQGVAVGEYSPINLSILGKAKALLSDGVYLPLMITLSIACVTGGLAFNNARTPGQKRWEQVMIVLLWLPSPVAYAFIVSDFGSFEDFNMFKAMFIACPALFLAFLSSMGSITNRSQWRFIIPAFIGINVLITMAFFWWLYLGLFLMVAKIAATILAVLAAIALGIHLRKNDIEKGIALVLQRRV